MKKRKVRFTLLSRRPLHLLQRITSRRNAMLLVRLFSAFVFILTAYSFAFHYLMHLEHRNYSVISGIYWTISTMTTLGLGDITFVSDAGRLFTILVISTGVVFLLILVPFTLIQLFQSSARVPRELPEGTSGHVILTQYDPLTAALIERLQRYGQSYVVLISDLAQAMELRDQGIRTVAGDPDEPRTFHELRIGHASFVVASASDVLNTSLAYAIRQVSARVPIIATASGQPAVPILEEAGCTHVLALDEMMGQSLARRTIAGDALAHVLGQIEEIIIAEAAAAGTPLVGSTIADSRVYALTGAAIVGIWEGSAFRLPSPETMITKRMILVLAGLQQNIDRYNELFCIYNITTAPIVIVGAGSVGRALGRAMQERDLDFRVIERTRDLIPDDPRFMLGDATERKALEQAGFFEAPAVAVTSHNDPVNIYLTTYFRYLRKDIQIISRATLDRSIHTLQRAGCDFVLSHASLGANNILGLSKRGSILMIAEGVDVFRIPTPRSIRGMTIRQAALHTTTGCGLIGLKTGTAVTLEPGEQTVLDDDSELVLIGTIEAQERLFRKYRPSSER